jgi:hypothetical protein
VVVGRMSAVCHVDVRLSAAGHLRKVDPESDRVAWSDRQQMSSNC